MMLKIYSRPNGRYLTDVAPTTSTISILTFVLAPFVTGYFLSYYFRTVNAVLSERLAREIGLDASQLGLMTSAYFLMAALAQLPGGWLLDRYGPRLVQIGCLSLAGLGALLFATAQDFTTLFAARALIGLGVATALVAGLKAMVMAVPRSQIGLYNGVFMGIGATGALASSLPTEAFLASHPWRLLFVISAMACAISVALIWLLAPRHEPSPPGETVAKTGQPAGLWEIYRDPGFWRLAPLSALAIGGAWALQGLWSGPWLRDVAQLSQADIARQLLIVAAALSCAAVGLGIVVNALARIEVKPEATLGTAALLFVAAEVGVALRWPVSPLLLWCVIGAFGAGTVLSYTINAHRYPKESIGRANGALNLLHFAAAFAVQSLVGRVVALWPKDDLGHYPPESYATALLGLAAIQLLALLWFLKPLPTAEQAPAVSLLPAPGRLTRRQPYRLLLGLAAIGLLATITVNSLRGSWAPALASFALFPASTADDQAMQRLEARLAGLEERLQAYTQQVSVLVARSARNETAIAEIHNSVAALTADLGALHRNVQAAAEIQATAAPEPRSSSASLPTPEAKLQPRREDVCSAVADGGNVHATIRFAARQFEIAASSRFELDRLTRMANDCPAARLMVRGYADSRGSTSLNLRLSQSRAHAVRDQLIRSGIAPHRLQVAALGPADPVADNTTEFGRQQNRRVEVELIAPTE
ncbi:MAG: MFS transporter [Hyphomicrobiaceae bacterium]